MRFLIYLATVDVRRHIEGLCKLAESKYPGVPLGRFGFVVNYAGAPTVIDVALLDDLCKEAVDDSGKTMAGEYSGWDESSRRSNALLRITFAAGSRAQTLYHSSHPALPLVAPRIKLSATLGDKRLHAIDSDMRRIDSVYDEYDEFIRRISQAHETAEATAHQMSSRQRWPWARINDQTWATDADWPFESEESEI